MFALFVKGDDGWEQPRFTENPIDVIEFMIDYHGSAFPYIAVDLDDNRIINHIPGE